jgi:thymidine kinase|tara:strand:+ start:3385 stop:3960 length:576 start_codon:yes stop_codon:yes gene_type:complete
MAKLYFRYSTMGAGKSLDLLKTAYNYEERGKFITLLTSSLDNRYGTGKITSRVGISKDAHIFDSSTNLFEFVSEYCFGCDCVLIDESQFLTKEQVWQLTDIVDKLECNVITYGLRSDFKGEPFEGSIYLMTLADKIEELKTICKYGDKASMNMRMVNEIPIFDGDKVMIGGNDSYLPVCRTYYKKMKEKHG